MDSLLASLREIGREIRETLLRVIGDPDMSAITGMGADGTYTHRIDRVCEDIIIRNVKDLDLPVNVVSEEAGIVDRGATTRT
ncbi:hypothetical protein [Thermogymnomonas acidicola]|uniref:hypothetical protein n=1 Tax=Thermogymnomonas acidicola TaxID=399579 RepID=UPI0009461781|nr:hypothetical protein [Thermogymnomonas acidicola]